jgi:hypothetical protein
LLSSARRRRTDVDAANQEPSGIGAHEEDQCSIEHTWLEAPQHTFGLHPKGYLIITQEGRLMIMITADNRKAGIGDAERSRAS